VKICSRGLNISCHVHYEERTLRWPIALRLLPYFLMEKAEDIGTSSIADDAAHGVPPEAYHITGTKKRLAALGLALVLFISALDNSIGTSIIKLAEVGEISLKRTADSRGCTSSDRRRLAGLVNGAPLPPYAARAESISSQTTSWVVTAYFLTYTGQCAPGQRTAVDSNHTLTYQQPSSRSCPSLRTLSGDDLFLWARLYFSRCGQAHVAGRKL